MALAPDYPRQGHSVARFGLAQELVEAADSGGADKGSEVTIERVIAESIVGLIGTRPSCQPYARTLLEPPVSFDRYTGAISMSTLTRRPFRTRGHSAMTIRFPDSRSFLLALLLICLPPATTRAANPLDALWSDGFGSPGPDAQVTALLQWNGDLYAAGFFRQVDGQPAGGIARWDGSAWHPLPGISGTGWSLAAYRNHLFAAGYLQINGGTSQQRIVEWDGSSWHSVVSSLGGGQQVMCLAVYKDELYAGGDFDGIEGSPGAHIARWDGTSWSPVGLGVDQANCGGCGPRAMTEFNGELIVAGTFNQAGGIPVQNIARWNGTTWAPLGAPGSGSDNSIGCLLNADSVLVAGGYFTTIGGVSAHGIARWSGSSWQPYGAGLNEAAQGLTLHQGELYATGFGFPVRDVARWTGTAWVGIGGRFGYPATALQSYGGALVVAGAFEAIGGIPARDIARWDGSHWYGLYGSPRAMGVNGRVRAFIEYEGSLIVGGEFSTAAGDSLGSVARWTGAGYEPLGKGMNGFVDDFAIYNGQLIAAGGFTTADGLPANRVARWDGTTWHALGSGMNELVYTLTVFNGELIAGGLFTSAGGQSAARIAAWNGSTWRPLGSGFNYVVEDLTVHAADLVAVGGFWQTGAGAPVLGVAAWDGSAWHEVGGGLSRPYAVLSMGGDLFVGGALFGSGGFPPYPSYWGVLRWNGSRWDSLGVEPVPSVLDLLEMDGKLLVAGDFASPSHSGKSIARWNGSSWELLGSGTNNTVFALGSYQGALFAGGDFGFAGQKPSWHIGRFYPATGGVDVATERPGPLALGSGYPNPFSRNVAWNWEIKNRTRVNAKVVDVTGRVIRRFFDTPHAAGKFTLQWDGLDDHGVSAGAGVYMLVIAAEGRVESRKVIRLRNP